MELDVSGVAEFSFVELKVAVIGKFELSNDAAEETTELVTVTFRVTVAVPRLLDAPSAFEVKVLVFMAVSDVNVAVTAERELGLVTDSELVAPSSEEDECSRAVELEEVEAPVTPNAELLTQESDSVDNSVDSDAGPDVDQDLVPADLITVEA
ncbi:hypothetical protein E5D57_001955 [Metarhizium anisopliae]|nr:hypothetical protein E5D57_001955 [Metarhizium anisopliae]